MPFDGIHKGELMSKSQIVSLKNLLGFYDFGVLFNLCFSEILNAVESGVIGIVQLF
jgi:hypothetical protein